MNPSFARNCNRRPTAVNLLESHRYEGGVGQGSAERDEGDPDGSRDEPGTKADLLDENRNGQSAHPDEAHGTSDEEHEHEQPAAADAIEGMPEAHAHRAESPA